MKICIFGAGAIGSYLAVELSLAGYEVCAIARGQHLQAIQDHGLKLLSGGCSKIAMINASDDPHRFGPQDFVISALKAHQAYASAEQFAPLLGKDSAVVVAVNGIPWWYFYKSGGRFEGYHPQSVDRGGRLWRAIGPERAIGCVIDPACEIVAPGVVEHHRFRRFTLGEPDGTVSDRVQVLSRMLSDAGFDAPVREDIRWNVWLKLWGNVCFNPISALTLATLDRITTEPGLRAVCQAMMAEARLVGEAHGVQIPPEMGERLLAATGSVIGHKMSMLQDLERNRSMEIDAIVAAVKELGRMTDSSTPTIDMVLALVQERARVAGLYSPEVEGKC